MKILITLIALLSMSLAYSLKKDPPSSGGKGESTGGGKGESTGGGKGESTGGGKISGGGKVTGKKHTPPTISNGSGASISASQGSKTSKVNANSKEAKASLLTSSKTSNSTATKIAHCSTKGASATYCSGVDTASVKSETSFTGVSDKSASETVSNTVNVAK